MRKIIILAIIIIITSCGCKSNAKRTQSIESTNPNTTTESLTNETETQPVNEMDVISLFQSILLNETKSDIMIGIMDIST